jgi:hypothetical protein
MLSSQPEPAGSPAARFAAAASAAFAAAEQALAE